MDSNLTEILQNYAEAIERLQAQNNNLQKQLDRHVRSDHGQIRPFLTQNAPPPIVTPSTVLWSNGQQIWWHNGVDWCHVSCQPDVGTEFELPDCFPITANILYAPDVCTSPPAGLRSVNCFDGNVWANMANQFNALLDNTIYVFDNDGTLTINIGDPVTFGVANNSCRAPFDGVNSDFVGIALTQALVNEKVRVRFMGRACANVKLTEVWSVGDYLQLDNNGELVVTLMPDNSYSVVAGDTSVARVIGTNGSQAVIEIYRPRTIYKEWTKIEATSAGGYNFASGGYNKVHYATVITDVLTEFSAVNYNYTANEGGDYLIHAACNVGFSAGLSTSANLAIFVNNAIKYVIASDQIINPIDVVLSNTSHDHDYHINQTYTSTTEAAHSHGYGTILATIANHTTSNHTHSTGTYSIANHTTSNHTHSTGTYSIADHTTSNHTHGVGTYAIANHTTSNHTHTVGTYAVASHASHTHTLSWATTTHSHGGTVTPGNVNDGGPASTAGPSATLTHALSGASGSAGSETLTHSLSGASGSSGSEILSHSLSGASGSAGSEVLSHSLSGASGSAGSEVLIHNVTMSGSTTSDNAHSHDTTVIVNNTTDLTDIDGRTLPITWPDHNYEFFLSGSMVISLSAGDVLDIRLKHNSVGTVSQVNDTTKNYIRIDRKVNGYFWA